VYWEQLLKLLMRMIAANMTTFNHVCGGFVLLCKSFQQKRVIITRACRIGKRIIELLQFEQHVLKRGPIRLPVRVAQLRCISALDTSCATKRRLPASTPRTPLALLW
jgi:hypothetical protein